jgi:AmmeMemoRadiSam system protein A
VLEASERARLLEIARAAVEARIRRQKAPEIGDISAALSVPAGAFVSLHKDGALRGCVGFVRPEWALAETVAEAGAAVAADRRFPHLRPDELEDLEIEVSVLGPLEPITHEAVAIGRHGLVIHCAGRSGLLLPQVPVEQEWGREEFLRHLCVKAGLPPDSWRREDAQLFGFTAERFRQP